jgi:subtilisin family serine protease
MKLFRKIAFCFLLILFADNVKAQTQPTRYLVKFKNKAGNPFSLTNPSAYLSQRSIDRRTRYSIGLDSTDLPVTPQYIDSIKSVPNVTVLNVSKWLNQVSIQTTDAANALSAINSFSFVLSANPLAARTRNNSLEPIETKFEERSLPVSQQAGSKITADFFNYGLSSAQVSIHNGQFLHNIGLRGQNMIIGMLDAGYQNYLTVKAFDSARANGQILGTHDFVAREASVNEDNAHGMQCFSVIASNIPGQFVGTAPKANFYLFRTEEAATEYPIEEHNWVCGAEKLDSAGGDVISSSLGYYTFDGAFNTPAYNHVYADMTGNKTMPAIAADLAAKKGILSVIAAGNEGNNSWHYIITPADGDSVIAVGAVNSTGVVANFSSYGPSADGQVKPDVASVGQGTIIQNPNNTIVSGNGTSFACPNIAGLATCLWQGFPEYNNIKIINTLRQSGSIANTPNERIGYGIPDVKKAFMQLVKEFSSAVVDIANCKASIDWTSKDVATMKYEIERKGPGETNFIKISERFGTGSNFSTQHYKFVDDLQNTPAGNITYRIRQIIDTASATLSSDYIDTVSINLVQTCVISNENIIVLQPNPTRGQASIKISTPTSIQSLQIKITDLLGQALIVLNQTKQAGTVVVPLPTGNIATGKYFVSVYGDGKLIGTRELSKL